MLGARPIAQQQAQDKMRLRKPRLQLQSSAKLSFGARPIAPQSQRDTEVIVHLSALGRQANGSLELRDGAPVCFALQEVLAKVDVMVVSTAYRLGGGPGGAGNQENQPQHHVARARSASACRL